ncbi:MAG: protoporphyrinogen/coproporphyrinogen oxidase [Candidatus Aminicenantes bacterium]
MSEIVILGAGLSGLSAAYHLKKDYDIYEKEEKVGGLCRSIHRKDFIFDYGPHILFPKDKYTADLIRKLLGKNLRIQSREAWIYHKFCGTYTRFPFQSHLHGLPVPVVKDCILGFVETVLKKSKKPRNYEEWIIWNFGRGIADHLMIPYARKIWTVPPRRMNFEWVWNRVPRLSLDDLLEGALRDNPRLFGFNTEFWYPVRGGIEGLPFSFVPKLRNIHLKKEATRIYARKKCLEFSDKTRAYYQKLISTLPLPDIIRRIDHAPDSVRKAARDLMHNSVYCVNLGIKREKVSPYHYIYFYEPEFAFHRISFPMNLSPHTTPEGCSSITTETSYSRYKKISRENIVERVIEDLVKAKILLPDDEILVSDVADIKCAYVIYDLDHRKNVKKIHDYLRKHDIFPCGRFGEWEYFNMDHSLASGMRTAEKINQIYQE